MAPSLPLLLYISLSHSSSAVNDCDLCILAVMYWFISALKATWLLGFECKISPSVCNFKHSLPCSWWCFGSLWCGAFGTQALAGRCKPLGIDTESFCLALLSIESHDDQPQWGFNGIEGITPTSRDSVSTAAMRQNMSLLPSIVSVAYVPYPAAIVKKIKTIKGCWGRWGRQWICIKISRSMCQVKPFGYIVYLFSCSSLILNLLYMVLF